MSTSAFGVEHTDISKTWPGRVGDVPKTAKLGYLKAGEKAGQKQGPHVQEVAQMDKKRVGREGNLRYFDWRKRYGVHDAQRYARDITRKAE